MDVSRVEVFDESRGLCRDAVEETDQLLSGLLIGTDQLEQHFVFALQPVDFFDGVDRLGRLLVPVQIDDRRRKLVALLAVVGGAHGVGGPQWVCLTASGQQHLLVRLGLVSEVRVGSFGPLLHGVGPGLFVGPGSPAEGVFGVQFGVVVPGVALVVLLHVFLELGADVLDVLDLVGALQVDVFGVSGAFLEDHEVVLVLGVVDQRVFLLVGGAPADAEHEVLACEEPEDFAVVECVDGAGVFLRVGVSQAELPDLVAPPAVDEVVCVEDYDEVFADGDFPDHACEPVDFFGPHEHAVRCASPDVHVGVIRECAVEVGADHFGDGLVEVRDWDGDVDDFRVVFDAELPHVVVAADHQRAVFEDEDCLGVAARHARDALPDFDHLRRRLREGGDVFEAQLPQLVPAPGEAGPVGEHGSAVHFAR